MKKVVSYSLWCQEEKMDPQSQAQCKEMYCMGAIRNLELRDLLYPEWTFRYYIDDSVPDNIVKTLKRKGAEIVNMTNVTIPGTDKKYPGMFWRFLPFNDNNVDVFIVRDSDSRINVREALAVNEWLQSEKQLHVMRDHPHHKYKILGGMWGFNSNKGRPNFNEICNKFLKRRNYTFKRMDDMLFLDNIYDYYSLKNEVHENDSYYNNKSFPDNTDIDKYYNYVGEIFDENDNAVHKCRDSVLIEKFKR